MIDLLAKFNIHYDSATHRYSRFGMRLDSVSSCLPYLSNEWLDNNPEVLKKAKGRGDAIARYIEAEEWHIAPHGVMTSDIPGEKEKWGHFEQYQKFKRETGFRALTLPEGEVLGGPPIASELFVYHDLLDYVGRLDLVGVCENLSKDVTVIDVKATALLSKTVGPQTAGYFEAYNRNAKLYGLPKAKKRAVLWLTAKTYKYLPLDNPLDWPRFTSRLTDCRWARELGYRCEWKEAKQNGNSPTGDVLNPEDFFS